MTWKLSGAQTFGVVGAALLLFLPPLPSGVSSDLVLEPGRDAHVRTHVAGKVAQVLVHSDEEVKSGQLIAVMDNPEIEADAKVLQSELALVSSSLRENQNEPGSGKAAHAARERLRLQKELAVAEQNLEALRIRAPFDGIISTPQIEQRVGEYIGAGDEFCRVADRHTMKARILVPDREFADVGPGALVKVKVLPYAFRTYSGRVDQIFPAAAADIPVSQTEKLTRLGQALTNYIAVVMEFPNPDGSLSSGMTGVAKIRAKSRPLGFQMARGAWHWLRSQIWW